MAAVIRAYGREDAKGSQAGNTSLVIIIIGTVATTPASKRRRKKAEERRVRSSHCSEAGSDWAAFEPQEPGLQRSTPSAPCDLREAPVSDDHVAYAAQAPWRPPSSEAAAAPAAVGRARNRRRPKTRRRPGKDSLPPAGLPH
ncbi:hypothetical protein MTO96_039558 [Rhipicephalus appendiculatus]